MSFPINFQNLNGIRFANQFAGSDLGAQINNAFADAGSNSLVIAEPGPITTGLSIPVASVLFLMPGVYVINVPSELSSTSSKIIGCGVDSTILEINDDSIDVFTITGELFELRDLSVYGGTGTTYPIRTGGSVLNVQAGQGIVENVLICDPYNGLSFLQSGGSGWFLKDIRAITAGGNWNYLLKTRASAATIGSLTLQNIVANVQAAASIGEDLLVFDSGTDTIKGTQLELLTSGGKSCISCRDSAAFQAPRWIMLQNVVCETDNSDIGGAVNLQVCRDFRFQGYIASSVIAFNLGALAADVCIYASEIVNISQHAIVVSGSAAHINVSGNTFDQCCNSANNTYSVLLVAAPASNWKFIGNTVKSDDANKPAYGVSVASGASDHYLIIANLFSGVETQSISDGGTGTNKSILANV